MEISFLKFVVLALELTLVVLLLIVVLLFVILGRLNEPRRALNNLRPEQYRTIAKSASSLLIFLLRRLPGRGNRSRAST
jgi:hypothetical protein